MRTTVWRAKTVQIFSTPAPNQSFEPHCLSTMWYEEIESLAIDFREGWDAKRWTRWNRSWE
jgi:hypothetical protein